MTKWSVLSQKCKTSSTSKNKSVKFTISIDQRGNRCRKSLWQNFSSIHDKKNFLQTNNGRKYHQPDKEYLKKYITNIIHNRERLNVFPLRHRTKQRYTLLQLLFKIALEILASAIRKDIQNWKKK